MTDLPTWPGGGGGGGGEGFSLGAYGERVARNLKQAYTPSAAKATVVLLSVEVEGSGQWEIYVGGVAVVTVNVEVPPEETVRGWLDTFIVPAGKTWEARYEGVGEASVASSYAAIN